MSAPPSPAPAASPPPREPCCICMEVTDYQGTLLVQCRRCAIHVHVKCYGRSISASSASAWLCEACEHVSRQPSNKPTPQCAVCPVAGGALRLTAQSDVWCHVLCVNWIPELSHSLAGAMDEAVDISLLDKSRSSLRCIICTQRGGCIQCVSGRCAKAFHVLCAFRAPSSLLFTGYNMNNQQVYHCKTHLYDVSTTRYAMEDNSWRKLRDKQEIEERHPVTTEMKCRFCSNRVSAATKDTHETQCLLSLLARNDAQKRKKELARLGAKPVEISYKFAKSPSKKNGKSRSKSSPRRRSDSTNGKYKREATPMRECPECGESVRETLMMGHLRNSCPKSPHALKRMSKMMNGAQEEETADLTDVLFASWPGQNSGAPMDSTYFWKLVEANCFSSKVLEKKRMEQLSKNLCGVKLDTLAKPTRRRPLQVSEIHCRDTLRLERNGQNLNQPLTLQKVVHKCDYLMRSSHCRCLSDPLAKPLIEICHNSECTRPAIEPPPTTAISGKVHEDTEAHIRVLFKNGEDTTVDCNYSMRVAPSNPVMNQHTTDNRAVASSFQHDAVSTLIGFDMQTNKVILEKEQCLMISLDACDQVDSTPVKERPENTSQVPAVPVATTASANLALADEYTPAINLLIEHLQDATERNRFRIRTLHKKLRRKEADEEQFQLSAQITDQYYREFASWKRLCSSLLIGYKSSRDQLAEDDKKAVESDEQEGSTEDEDDAVDDGTCVVCFDGQSPETNPIVFCDRCELAVHQRCYGLAKVPSSEFICDRCRATREGLDPASSVFCQLCSLGDGAFKRTIDGKWVHIVCALWCPKVWIGNLFDLSDINLVGTTNQVRFANSVEEIDARIKQASGGQQIAPKSGDDPEVPALELGSLCVHCRVACGRTVQCCHPGCSTSFHPLCGWYDGLPMMISLGDERYMYAGGGAGLNFQMHCSKHLPDYYPASEHLAQRRRRTRFRIDSYFVMRNKDNYSAGAKKQADAESSLLSGSIVQAVLSAENKITATEHDPYVTDWTDMTVCSACFEYCAPVVGELTDVNMLHRRQFMIRCQYCNVYIHPECCISDIGSSAAIFRSNWICEKCTQTGGKESPECIVCAKATDYLMPCVDPPVAANHSSFQASSSKSTNSAIRPAPNGGQLLWLKAHQDMQRQQQGQANENNSQQTQVSNGVAHPPASNRWIHVYCSKWQKTKTVKRHHMLCAYPPTLKSEGMSTRCELCDEKEGALANCAQCSRRFHPICAAQKKLYCARSNRTEWKFYCEDHPPVDAAFDVNRQTWITQEILSHLQDLRRSLERGRMLLEMSRQRDRQQRRLLTLCRLPLMEASIEVVLKKRPSAQMKEVYHQLTGDVLTDVPHHRKVAIPTPPRNRVRSSPRAASGSRSRPAKRAATPSTPERSSKRRRTRSDADGVDSAPTERSSRRSSRRKSPRNNQPDSEDEDMGMSDDDAEKDEVEAQKKLWASLKVPEDVEDFDLVIAEEYPGLVIRQVLRSIMSEVEVVAHEGDMQPSSCDGLTGAFDSTVPSTAASTTETIDSGEEVRCCDEWELFSDTDQRDASGGEVSVDDSDEEIDPLASNCVDTDLRLTPAQLDIESAIVLERSRRDDTDRQESASHSDEHGLQALPCTSDGISDKELVHDPVAEEERPISQSEPSADASIHRRIQVFVRVRPPLDNEGKVVVTAGETEGTSLCVQTTTSQGSISIVTQCRFDRVFMGAATQESVFAAVEPSVQACLEGYNATVFGYGQTGTGKTHTLFGRDLGASNDHNTCEGGVEQESDSSRMVKSSWGIVPRTLSYLLDQAAVLKQKDCQVELHLSFLQIYNDRLFDLLTDRMRQKPLLIREQPTLDGTTSVTVQGLTSERITSFSNAMRIIHQAHTNRSVRETEANSSSSRSHAIVQLHVTTQCPTATGSGDGRVLRKARLNLVDLAGSEKWNTDVEMEDSHSQELKNINTSLSALGNCIAALGEAGRKHIPYRDSTLTRVLQDSFGGNTQSCLIATVNATQQSCDETIRTLQFADRARSVMQTTRVNEVADGSTELLMAKIQIVKLRERLESEQRRRHETRLKEHQAMQREFQDKLKAKDKEITKLTRDNAVFQKWREEDVQKIRTLESRVKDLERQIDVNENRNNEILTDAATSNPAQLPTGRRQGATPASIAMAKPTVVQKTRSRTNLIRAGSDNSSAARTYKQVLERYTLGANKDQLLKATQNTLDQTKTQEPTCDETNQLEEQTPGLHTSSPMKLKPQRETGADDSQANGSHGARLTVTRYPSSGLCVSPIAAAVPSSTNNSWVYSNVAASMASFNSELTSSALSKSTPAMMTHKRESSDKHHDPRSPKPAPVSAWKQESLNNGSSLSSSFLLRASATSGRTTEPCQKHKLAGCMLCSVNESFQSIQAAPARQPNVAIVSSMTKLNEPSRKTQDGPCERHQLLRCFICTKGGVSSSSDFQVATTSSSTSASSMYSYSSTTASTVRGSNRSYQSTEAQSKCALHALANCILCAGVKAMTRKVAVPTPQPSPAKSVAMFNVRSGDARADDRYRRYTLDERILNYEARAKQATNEW